MSSSVVCPEIEQAEGVEIALSIKYLCKGLAIRLVNFVVNCDGGG